MRPAFLLLIPLLLAPVLAGCLSDDGEAPTPPPPPARAYSTFLCGENSTVLADAVTGNGSRCNVRITGNLPRENTEGNELTIAVNPNNPLQLVAGAKDYTLGKSTACGENRVWAGYYWSQDGGFTWGNDLMPGFDKEFSEQQSTPLAGYQCTTDPVAVWDFEGNALFSGLSYAAERTPGANPIGASDVGSNVWLAKSSDGGATYTSFGLVAQGDGAQVFHDKQWFAVDARSGNIYFTWSMFVFGPPVNVPVPIPGAPATYTDQIVFSKSTDGGSQWSPPKPLYESDEQAGVDTPAPEQSKQFSMPQVDAAGNIHVIWMDERGRIQYTVSDDEGETWTTTRPIVTDIAPLPGNLDGPGTFRTATYPVLAIDRSGNDQTDGHLYISYAAFIDNQHADVFVVKSADSGDTWSDPVRVNDDNTTHDQFMPWIEVGPRGDVHVVFHDRRDDPNDRFYHTYYAHSENGTIWDANVRLSEVASDPSFSRHQGGFEFIGDYIQITEGTDGRVHPIWVDTRDGRADVYTTTLAR